MIKIVLPFLKRYNIVSMTAWPFLFIRAEKVLDDKVTMNHELIHAAQQKEMLLAGFYLAYYTEYFTKAAKYGWDKAYYEISFEKECYQNENNLNYLKERKPFAWRKLL